MKIAALFVGVLPIFAADNLARFVDANLNQTQRNEACVTLRGDKSPEVIAAMRAALEDMRVQACAGMNLRLAGAGKQLLDGLSDSNNMVRAVSARELGSMQKPEYIPALRKAAEDRDLLVQSNALEGLVRYDNRSTAPQLREIALLGGILTSLSLDALIEWHDPEIANIARKLLTRTEPGDLLAGIRALGIAGDKQDLPALKVFAKDDLGIGAGGRGFGLMPAISIGRAASTAIANIEKRASN